MNTTKTKLKDIKVYSETLFSVDTDYNELMSIKSFLYDHFEEIPKYSTLHSALKSITSIIDTIDQNEIKNGILNN